MHKEHNMMTNQPGQTPGKPVNQPPPGDRHSPGANPTLTEYLRPVRLIEGRAVVSPKMPPKNREPAKDVLRGLETKKPRLPRGKRGLSGRLRPFNGSRASFTCRPAGRMNTGFSRFPKSMYHQKYHQRCGVANFGSSGGAPGQLPQALGVVNQLQITRRFIRSTKRR